jgi:hypothetical protein
MIAIPKSLAFRSEPYRRLVAALPCIHCGRPGPSQAAHPSTGRGMAQKTDDRLCFPLCAPRLGEPGCHARFDQGALFTKAERREMEVTWTRETVRLLRQLDRWPQGMPLPAIDGIEDPCAAGS